MSLTKIKGSNITDNTVAAADIAPGTIPTAKISTPGSGSVFLQGDGSFGEVDVTQAETNAFNVGLLGFKMAVSEGLTVYNLVDGVVDEFHDESGIDTPENTTANYDSTSDFYQNLDLTPGIAMFLGVESVTFETPAHAPLITHTSQEAVNGAFGAQGSITFPSLTTSIEATMVGAGGGNNAAGDGGPGGSVDATIANSSIAGATWDYVVGEGGNGTGYATPGPQAQGSGGYGGGGSGATGGGGGFTGIFDGEVTIIEGGTYNESGFWQTPGTPNSYPDEGPGFADTVSPTNAGEAVLIVGSGAAGVNSNKAPQAQGGGGGFTAGTDGSGGTSVPTTSSGGTNSSGGGADLEANGHMGAYPYGEGVGFGPAEWTQESPNPNAIHFQGGGVAYTPGGGPLYGGGGSGYHGGGSTSDNNGSTGGSGGGAGHANPTYVASPTITTEAAVASGSAPSTESVFDEAPYFTGLPSPRQAFFAEGTRGEGSESGNTNNGGDGGILLVFDGGSTASNMTLISDTFTAQSTPSKARIVVFAELPDGTSDFTVSATRDNSTFNSITLTDEGFQAGSSGIKIFTGSTPLTGTASPQVALRWKVVGSSLTGENKIHGVALQWA